MQRMRPNLLHATANFYGQIWTDLDKIWAKSKSCIPKSLMNMDT